MIAKLCQTLKSEGPTVFLLAALSVAFFWKIALTNLILVGLDVFTYFYPYRAYAAEALREGRLPLWNPYLFLGAPFLANSQAAVLYPLNWVLSPLPVPRLVACSIVLHIFLAGLFTYLFARLSLKLGRFGAFLSAVVFACGGFLGAQVEHINQLNVFAWLPLSLLLYDRALVSFQKRTRYILLGGGTVALELLAGHIQAVYICLFALGIYMLGRWAVEGRKARSLLLGLAIYFAMVALGLLLSAAQLLPTYELWRLSIRAGGLPLREAVSFSLRPHLLPYTLLPAFGEDLSQVFGESFGEYVAYAGVVGLVLALVGVISARKEGLPFILIAASGLFLAFGLYNPFYFLFYKLLPGFSSFRAPVRWLFLWAFGVAMLAGLGGDRWASGQLAFWSVGHLVSLKGKGLALWKRRAILTISGLALVALTYIFVVSWPFGRVVSLIWLALAVVAIGMMAAKRRFLVLALVIGELWVAGQNLAYNNPTAPEAFSFLRPALTYLLTEQGLHRFLSLSELTYDPGDLKDIQNLFAGQLPPKAIYDYVVAEKRKEVLSFNLPLLYRLFSVDGYDGGILPLKSYVEFQRLFLEEDEISPDGRLREQLKEVPDGRLLSLLNVKYIITDKVYDVWIDDVFYDLGHKAWLEGKEEFVISALPRLPATALGVVSFLSGGAGLSDGTPVAEIKLSDASGWEDIFILRAGRDTAEGEYDSKRVRHAQARVGQRWRERPEGADYITTFEWDKPHYLERLSIRYLAGEGKLCLHGLSLIDRRTGAHLPLTFSSSGHFRLVHSGDVKIYENLDVIPRAFIVHRARVESDDRTAISLLKDPSFRPEEEVILSSGLALGGKKREERVKIISYEPEHVAVEAELEEEGYLVLSDTFYPGWKALVDGQEVPLLRADVLFRAVYLPPGIHRVEFIYSPISFKIGLTVSLISLLGWLFCWTKRAR